MADKDNRSTKGNAGSKQRRVQSDDASEQNQGEGNRDAARRFNATERAFVKSRRGRRAAADAAKDDDTGIEKELRTAERKASKRAAEHDPAVTRDYQKRS